MTEPEVICVPGEPKEIGDGWLGGMTADSVEEAMKIEREMVRM